MGKKKEGKKKERLRKYRESLVRGFIGLAHMAILFTALSLIGSLFISAEDTAYLGTIFRGSITSVVFMRQLTGFFLQIYATPAFIFPYLGMLAAKHLRKKSLERRFRIYDTVLLMPAAIFVFPVAILYTMLKGSPKALEGDVFLKMANGITALGAILFYHRLVHFGVLGFILICALVTVVSILRLVRSFFRKAFLKR